MIEAGSFFAGHKILSLIGTGASSDVFKARQPHLDRFVAIKVFKPGSGDLLRFHNEAKLACKLHHPNIARVLSCNLSAESPHIVYEFVEGQTLAQRLRDNVEQSDATIQSTVLQLCAALAYAHSQGLIHRDVKPSNIMVEPNGNIKLLDFGSAVSSTATDQRLTRTNEFVGTPAYMSPEQASGKQADARSDIYSLGCVLYELLEGRPLFTASNSMEMLLHHARTAPPRIRSTRSDSLKNAAIRMLQKNPNRRYQSASDAAAALELLSIASGAKMPARSAVFSLCGLLLMVILAVSLVVSNTGSNTVLRSKGEDWNNLVATGGKESRYLKLIDEQKYKEAQAFFYKELAPQSISTSKKPQQEHSASTQ